MFGYKLQLYFCSTKSRTDAFQRLRFTTCLRWFGMNDLLQSIKRKISWHKSLIDKIFILNSYDDINKFIFEEEK